MKAKLGRSLVAVTAILVTGGVLSAPTATAVAPSTSAHARAAAVTLKASAARVDAGQRLVLTGTVRNRAKGATVVVQRLLVGVNVWKPIAKVRVGKAGAVRYVDRPTRMGDRKYRLVVPRAGSRAQAVSKAVPVTVWAWVDLNDLAFDSRRATFQRQDTWLFGGDLHVTKGILSDSVVDNGWMTWRLDGACTKVRATMAATDDSLDRAHVQLEADDAVLDEGDVEGSTSHLVRVDRGIPGATTLTFRWQALDPDVATVVMYDALVYCS